MTPEQRSDIILYRLDSARNLLLEIESHIERGFYNTAMNRSTMLVFMLQVLCCCMLKLMVSKHMKVYAKCLGNILF